MCRNNKTLATNAPSKIIGKTTRNKIFRFRDLSKTGLVQEIRQHVFPILGLRTDGRLLSNKTGGFALDITNLITCETVFILFCKTETGWVLDGFFQTNGTDISWYYPELCKKISKYIDTIIPIGQNTEIEETEENADCASDNGNKKRRKKHKEPFKKYFGVKLEPRKGFYDFCPLCGKPYVKIVNTSAPEIVGSCCQDCYKTLVLPFLAEIVQESYKYRIGA